MSLGRLTIATCMIVIVTASDSIAQPIAWTDDVGRGLAIAGRSGLPVLFYLDAEIGIAESFGKAQATSFSDSSVGYIVRERFVPIRLNDSSICRVLLHQMNADGVVAYSVVVSSRGGRLVGTISFREVAQPEVLADKLMALFREFRTTVFRHELKSVINDKSTSPQELIKAQIRIGRLLIVEADSLVIKLLKRKGLAEGVKIQAYKTLAALSTKRSVNVLLKAALRDEDAAEALFNCTPAGAEALLPALSLWRPKRLMLAYRAAAHICAIDATDPQLFEKPWRRIAKVKEIRRVKRAVKEGAGKWRAEFERFR